MVVTATELKTNIGKYLAMADTEDIIITKNGRSIAKLTNARDSKLIALHSLRGILRGTDVNPRDVREKRLAKYTDESALHGKVRLTPSAYHSIDWQSSEASSSRGMRFSARIQCSMVEIVAVRQYSAMNSIVGPGMP